MAPPTLLRTPIAHSSALPFSGLMRRTCDVPLGGRHSLHGGPTGMYSSPFWPTVMYFQPCGV
jgi:hypothetical protein